MKKAVLIAGPCMAESWELLDECAGFIGPLAKKLDVDLFFKASFDKANRTAHGSPRGPGIEKVLGWFSDLKSRYGFKILTDVHESSQVAEVASVCDALQIPAFLCRQTDLVLAAAATHCMVNVKKGQFMAPEGMNKVMEKAQAHRRGTAFADSPIFVTERGFTFGYGDLVVDMRGLPILAQQAPVIFDLTHSTQKPSTGSSTSGGLRSATPILGRSAAATGALSGFFLEIHRDPKKALSDADSQLTFAQAEILLPQILGIWRDSQIYSRTDREFL